MKLVQDISYDVIIAGGGVAGSVAAISAARCGAKVLIIERSGHLGGSLTSCGVGPMMTFHADTKQIIKGIGQEIVERMIARGYSPGHVRDTTGYVSYLTPFSSEGLKVILDEMITEAKVDILFHTFISAVQTESSVITAITISNKDGISHVKGKVFVDATGDGDVAAWSGAKTTKGRPSDGQAQPMTMNMKYCNVDTELLRDYIYKHIDEFPRLKNHGDLLSTSQNLAVAGFSKELQKAREQGEISIQREEILFFETSIRGEFIVNTTRILNHDATDARSLSDAEMIGRKQCAELDYFLKKYVPGFKQALLEFTGPAIGVRGSRQLIGTYILSAEDILERKVFKSVISHASYPIDIHNPSGAGTDSTFMFEKGAYYSIPYEVMHCPEVKNLIVTGRCISASFEAQAAIRTTPTVCALGHAAGAAAALAAEEDGDARKIDIQALQKKLVQQNAYLELV
jgi:ribulose 1,5-bisphosphate synthetase/thiazole synthase